MVGKLSQGHTNQQAVKEKENLDKLYLADEMKLQNTF